VAKKVTFKSGQGPTLLGSVFQQLKDQTNVAIQEAQNPADVSGFFEYRNNFAGFAKDVLKVKIITDDQGLILKSIEENPITLARSANATGKTNIAGIAVVCFYKIFSGKGVEIYTTAIPEKNLRTLLWKEILSVVNRVPGLFIKDVVKPASLSIKFDERNFIDGVTIPQTGDAAAKEARFSGKHAPYMLFVVDEGDAIPVEVYRAIESCMSGGHARLLILFNPRSQTGPLYQMEKSGSANVVRLSAFNHLNVLTGFDVIPGAVTRDITVRRIQEWTRPIIQGERIGVDVFMVPEFLIGFVAKKKDGKTEFPPLQAGLRKITEPAFSYMVLGEYSAQSENQLISREWIHAAQNRWIAYKASGSQQHLNTRPKLGVDVAELGSDTNVVTPRYDFFVDAQKVWAGVDTLVTGTNVIMEMRFYDAEGAYIDSNGLGAGVWPIVRKAELVAHRIMVQESPTKLAMIDEDVIGEFDRIRDQGWWELREFLRKNPRAMIPPDEELEDQLAAPTYHRDPRTGRIKICDNDAMKALLNGKSPDKASSLMLTFCPDNDDSGASYLTSTYY